jgi:putative radical SAM enzyme (TIGR03279 family)
MSAPRVVAVAPGSPAARAGVVAGDEIAAVNGEVPRDLLEWRTLVDEPEVALEVRRGGLETLVQVAKPAGAPLGVDVHSALFDRVRTCDNHCEFCFIYQLPPGLRRSLYLKDDDYRLSFLYGNFTTLTRFTEADLERVLTERLSPLYVSIHATDPAIRAEMLRNRRGATSLRWLRALLDHGVEVHGQVVVCPGVNDGAVLDDTLAGTLDRFPELASLCVVPLGVSRFNTESRMRPHTPDEARGVLDAVHDWQDVYLRVLGRRLVFAADEYYLLAGRPFPPAGHYGDFSMYEDGIGMARAFESELLGAGVPRVDADDPDRGAFFRTADAAGAAGARPRTNPAPGAHAAAPGAGAGASGCGVAGLAADVSGSTDADYEPYRAVRATGDQLLSIGPRPDAAVAVLTGPYGARVIEPLLSRLGRPDVRVVPVENRYFGGNVGVSGLMVGEDLARVLRDQPAGHRYLLPDVCLTQGVFLDGTAPANLPRPVEIVPTDGAALRAALGLPRERRS